MAIDFKEHFGVNAGYVSTLFEQWRTQPEDVEPEWRTWFERLAPEKRPAAAQPVDTEDAYAEPLRGVAAKIADNMTTSLEVPTATSVRTLPVKVLDENRRILNAHMRVRALGKASYTHLIAFAIVQALREMSQLQAFYEVREKKAFKVTPKHVSLGLAIDIATGKGRSLVVPNLPRAEELSFRAFHKAYEDMVAKARQGTLSAADFQGTTASLTNPGGFGTHMSVPRLMAGQGLILATGAIGVPTEARGMARGTLAELALGPVMTMTATYDHRVIQGAESGLLLKRVDELLQGADGFWEDVFRSMRVPWTPVQPAPDHTENGRSKAEGETQAKVWSLINAYRVRGCFLADLDPLQYKPEYLPSLNPDFYGFTIWDLDREFLTGGMCGKPVMTLREILEVLRESYCRRWTIEYMHISDRTRKHWVRDRIEPCRNDEVFDHPHRVRILNRLIKAENFERFLHTRYVGNKRFSLEGAEVLIPAMAELIDRAAENGIEKVVIGMAHRGRLNVLANILNKSYEQIFREFEGVLLPRSTEGSGDVKYHLGQRGIFETASGKQVEVILSANPSHLDAVDPVVCGMVRGYQDELQDSERKKVLGVLVHGDAAFTGQGVVAETLNMSDLPGYANGGTVHLIVNNQIGFTTGPRDLRSTYYCTDMAKGIHAPILHANGDYPESVLKAVHVAADYHNECGRDVVLDIVCYRRWGHNEGDEPAYTQPVLYRQIKDHPTTREHYTELLIRRGAMSREEVENHEARFDEELRSALAASKSVASTDELPIEEIVDIKDDDPADYQDRQSPETGVAEERLVQIVESCTRMPEGHVTHPNLLRQLHRREKMVHGEVPIDWGCAELLAFGSLLEDGIPVRLSGQDSGRGTFSHRHAIIRDQVTEADYIPLNHLKSGMAKFEVRDSPLSETAVLGFEYGYTLARMDSLVLWEAQFGDFANGAQIPIDQFIAPGGSKWRQWSGVTLLLPHGYDGQGPEHSSGRMERFLQLCSEGNLIVANCSTSAQYFHLLRRQGLTSAEQKRPLILFTPKSLLRDKRAAGTVDDFSKGCFEEVIADEHVTDPRAVRRLVFCSGKVYHDLQAYRIKEERQDVALVRLEQIYPLPLKALRHQVEAYPQAELIWAQEEPRNMGAWRFLLEQFSSAGLTVSYSGRPSASSTATGSYKRHVAEQDYLLRRTFGDL